MNKVVTLFFSSLLVSNVFLLSGCGSSSSGSGTGVPSGSGLIGTWTGTWTNTTFMSSGDLLITVVDNGNDTYDVTVDLDGTVGGQPDPDAQTVTVAVASDGSVSFDGNVDVMGTPGQLIFTVSSTGDLSISMPSIPIMTFDSFTATGNISSGSGSLNYTVNFSPTGSASGTASATKS
jgi:hypothetical protein